MYLIFTNFYKCKFVILVDYFFCIGQRLFKHLFLGIFIIFEHFLKLLLIILVLNFSFVNVFYLNNLSPLK